MKNSVELDSVRSQFEPPCLELYENNQLVLKPVQSLITLERQLAIVPPSGRAIENLVEKHLAFDEKAAQIIADATAWEAWHAAHASADGGVTSGMCA